MPAVPRGQITPFHLDLPRDLGFIFFGAAVLLRSACAPICQLLLIFHRCSLFLSDIATRSLRRNLDRFDHHPLLVLAITIVLGFFHTIKTNTRSRSSRSRHLCPAEGRHAIHIYLAFLLYRMININPSAVWKYPAGSNVFLCNCIHQIVPQEPHLH